MTIKYQIGVLFLVTVLVILYQLRLWHYNEIWNAFYLNFYFTQNDQNRTQNGENGIGQHCAVNFLSLLDGLEGKNGSDGKLVGVKLLIRHGHRTPMRRTNDVYGQEICNIGKPTTQFLMQNKMCLRNRALNIFARYFVYYEIRLIRNFRFLISV